MKNEEASFSLRLDQIETQWSLLLRAHEMASADALNTLVLRYSPVIRGYIRNLTRNDADADELAQEAVIRILKGDFFRSGPEARPLSRSSDGGGQEHGAESLGTAEPKSADGS